MIIPNSLSLLANFSLTAAANKTVLILFILSLALVNESLAINRDQLWLPREYNRHLGSLSKAAEIAEQMDRCLNAIAGTLSQEKSTKEHPVFVITCRDKERKSFAYIVDGLSLDVLNGPPPPPPPDPEADALLEEQNAIKDQWMICSQQIKKRTAGLYEVVWLGPEVPEPIMEENEILGFVQDFDASNSDGSMLRFKSTCYFDEGNEVVEIHARFDTELKNKEAENEVDPVPE